MNFSQWVVQTREAQKLSQTECALRELATLLNATLVVVPDHAAPKQRSVTLTVSEVARLLAALAGAACPLVMFAA